MKMSLRAVPSRGRRGLWPRSNPARVSTGRSRSGTDWVFVDESVAEVLQLDRVLVEVRQMSVSSTGEPRCCRKVLYQQSWLFGRLDGVSSDRQGTFGSIDDGYRMMRHLENRRP